MAFGDNIFTFEDESGNSHKVIRCGYQRAYREYANGKAIWLCHMGVDARKSIVSLIQMKTTEDDTNPVLPYLMNVKIYVEHT